MNDQEANVTYVIGAAPDADIRIDKANVSSHHARLSRVGRGHVLEDLQSTNGTFVDGNRITTRAVTEGSRIGLGSHAVTLAELLAMVRSGVDQGVAEDGTPHSPQAAVNAGPAQTHLVGSRMLIIGRNPECDICIPEPGVSGRHARVFRNAGRLIIEDLGSANGTWANDKRISWSILKGSSIVRVGSQGLQFKREERQMPSDTSPGARVDLRGVSVDVRDQQSKRTLQIVRDVSFTAFPGEIVGVMGPSGSGKTTLLSALAGFGAPSAGQILLNGESPYSRAATLRKDFGPLVGFAPQDDIVHELLTVEEAVRFAAKLRCPRSTSSAEIEQRTLRAIRDVGLEDKRNVRVGSTASKSLSGGQRKRVNIAMELVTNPPLLLLDEPTSGLSSHDAAELMDLLRRLADEGRTVILTIHQPSYAMFVQMDQLVMLGGGGTTEADTGRLVYFGPTGVDVFEYLGVAERHPAALLDRLAEPPGDGHASWSEKYARSDLYRRCVETRRNSLEQERPTPLSVQPPRGALSTLQTLFARGLLMKTRDGFFWVIAVVVPLVVSALLSLVLRTQLDTPEPSDHPWTLKATVAHEYLVVMTIMVCFFGALSSALEILYERAILRRERRGGLGTLPYLGSKAVLYAIPAVLHPAASLAVFIAMGQAFQGDFGTYFGAYYPVLVPAFFASVCAGLCLSSALRSVEGVVGFAVAFAIIQTVFSAFAPLSVVGKDPSTRWLDWASYPVTARWTLEGLVTRRDICTKWDDGSKPPQAGPFATTCRTNFYADHGVTQPEKNDKSENERERTSPTYFRDSTIANGSLAVLALAAAAVILKRRKS